MPSSLERSSESGRPSVEDRQPPSNNRKGTQGGQNHGNEDIDINEQSPLLSPAREGDAFIGGHGLSPDQEEDEFQTTKSVWYLILLTISIGGLQIAWSVELSNGSPYLLSLGLSKSLMALVWIAGPLSGTLVQPYVGMLSDNCRISWGKRKPFMIGGAVATVVSFMALAWTKEFVGSFLGLFGADPTSEGVKISIIAVAVLWVYILDFAINTVQAAIRAFIVDCAPPHQQEAANSMASRITGVGNIIGYVAGYVNLPKIVGFLGDTQFKDLCAIASIGLLITVFISCLCIRERDPRGEGPPPRDRPGILAFFAKIFKSIKRLPPQTKKVCMVQFCAWVGFFPMLFYTSSYIGEIYVEPFLQENPNMTPEELDRLYEKATRVGTFALLIFSITSLATNVFLPFVIAPSFDGQTHLITDGAGEGSAASIKDLGEHEKTWLDRLVIPGFTLRRAWMYSQVLFTGSMFCTVFVRTVPAATVLIGLVGITWALTLWAPWAIISAEISQRDALSRARKRALSPSRHDIDDLPTLDGYSDHGEELNVYEEEAEDKAGVILGIHNMAIAAPQIIATVASSIIFKFFQKPRGTPGDHSIAIVLALGGITVFISAFFIHRIEDNPAVLGDGIGAAEAGEASERRPGTSHSEAPRRSMERAALVRSSSFAGGLEY